MISFKRTQYPKSVILYAVYFYLRFPVSYRDLEEIMTDWVEKCAGTIATEAYRRKAPTGCSWRMDETYVKVKGRWTYLYHAIDEEGETLGFMLSERRWSWLIAVRRTKYLNNIIKQDHRFIKKLTRPVQTFKSFNSAGATLAGIEVAHMIRKGQFDQPEQSDFGQFAVLAG